MGKRQDNLDRIITKIESAAKLYREHLVGKRFLYVFEGRYIEVIYKTKNFRHLTGAESKISARRFYRNAVNNVLQSEQVYFTKKHPYNLCLKKIKHLNEVATLASSESFMLEEIKTATQMYKFGTTDLNFAICLNKEKDSQGNEIGDCYVVESLRDEDCFSKSKSAYTVTHVFSRNNTAKKYTDLLFMDNSASMDDLPETVKDLLAETLLAGK